MRTILLSTLLAASALGGCKWSEFDQISDTTWAHSTQKPSLGSTNYGIAIVGVTSQSTGGQLAVLSNDTPNYSTLDYQADGSADVGPNPQKLGVHFIASLSDPPILVTDGTGKVAVVERAIDAGNIAVVTGPANAVADKPFASMNTPDAATFAGANLVVAAANTFYTVGDTGVPAACSASDTSLKMAAIASDGTTMYVWTTAGVFTTVPVSALSPCNGGNLPAFGSGFTTTGVMPTVGSKIHLLLAKYAVLVSHPLSGASQIIVVDTTNMTQVGTTITISEGVLGSATGGYGGAVYLAVGIPTRSVNGLQNAGQVELYEMAPSTGMLAATPALALNDAQPESGQEFGHTVTTMKFNGQEILVVGAHSEIFAYYKTALYDALPAK